MSFKRWSLCSFFVLAVVGSLAWSAPVLAQDVPTIEDKALETEMQSKQPPFLLDVREPAELAESGFIKGSMNIPLSQLATRLGELPKNKPIVVYCRSGHRSAKATAFLRMSGFTQVESLSGGMNEWQSTHSCAANKAC